MYKIEKKVPLPNGYGKRSAIVELAKQMKPGDSVVVENQSRVASLTTELRRIGYQTASRKHAEGKNGERRVWCLEPLP